MVVRWLGVVLGSSPRHPSQHTAPAARRCQFHCEEGCRRFPRQQVQCGARGHVPVARNHGQGAVSVRRMPTTAYTHRTGQGQAIRTESPRVIAQVSHSWLLSTRCERCQYHHRSRQTPTQRAGAWPSHCGIASHEVRPPARVATCRHCQHRLAHSTTSAQLLRPPPVWLRVHHGRASRTV